MTGKGSIGSAGPILPPNCLIEFRDAGSVYSDESFRAWNFSFAVRSFSVMLSLFSKNHWAALSFLETGTHSLISFCMPGAARSCGGTGVMVKRALPQPKPGDTLT